MKNIYVFVFNGLADWEIGLITYELNTNIGIPVKTVGWTRDGVLTGGGLTVLPDLTIADIDPEETELLILPGGEMWHNLEDKGLADLIRQVYQAGAVVAGICAASLYLVKIGMFDGGFQHTSNGLDYLTYYLPDYELQEYYLDAYAVSDEGIITARGEAPFEFAYQILRTLRLYEGEVLAEFAEFWHCRGV